MLAYQIRANVRHHGAHLYAVTPGPVREDQHAVASVRVQKGGELAGVESLRDKLKAEGDLVIVFGDADARRGLRKLIAFGDSLGIPVKYVCLVDYSNSRGAFDMGLIPRDGGMSREQMLAPRSRCAVGGGRESAEARAALAAPRIASSWCRICS